MSTENFIPKQIILDISEPLKEFHRRLEHNCYAHDDVDMMIEHVWYGIQHKGMTLSILMDLGCRYRNEGHVFSPAVSSFGFILQQYLERLGFYQSIVGLNIRDYHYVKRHGPSAILVRR